VARKPRSSDEIDEGPSEADLDKFSDVTQKCPECGTELYDDVELCWNCGHALLSRPEKSPASMIVVLVVVMLVLIVLVFWKVF
jgi:uncharacterized protein (DUF983 family)